MAPAAAFPPLQPPGLRHVTLTRLGGGAAAAAFAASAASDPAAAQATASPTAAAAATLAAAAKAAASAPEGSVALLSVAKEPVNSMDADLWLELHAALRACEQDPSVRSLVIASGLKKEVFTAGNDLKELYAPLTSPARYSRFWDAQSSFLCDLLVSPLATVAAVRGACPAGGCCMALCCDRRVATGQASLGLNEVALGIPVPKFWARLMALRSGGRVAERLCLGGEQVGAAEALALGLVDEVVGGEGQGAGGGGAGGAGAALVAAGAARWAARQARLPPAARHATKLALRGEFERAWRAYALTEEAAFGWGAISDPATVARLRAVLERLGGGGGGGGGASKAAPGAAAAAARAKL